MPRKASPIRLRLDKATEGRQAIWYIIDGRKRVSTGCGESQAGDAEERLSAYIASKYEPVRRERPANAIPVADVIAIYADAVVAAIPNLAQRKRAIGRMERLLAFWGNKTLAQVNGDTSRAYARQRGNDGGSRRDLQDLSAAIGHHLSEGYHREIIKVVLPRRGERRERWLDRSELARLVRAAWRMRETMRRSHSDPNAERLPTRKRTGKHLARAILFGYYTASRPGDIFSASFHAGAGRSYIDLDKGVFYRKPEDKAATKKRQIPVRLGDRILAHLRRWRDGDHCSSYVVEWEGRRVQSVDTAFARAVDAAGLGDDITMYTLRHSRLTSVIQGGMSKEIAAEHGSTSVQMIEKHYWHHSPRYQREVANAR